MKFWITPEYFYCDNATIHQFIRYINEHLDDKIPLIDKDTCETINVIMILLLVSAAFGAVVNFIICCSYTLKFCREPSEFNQSDVLISSMATLDFVSALLLEVGTIMFARQPVGTESSVIEISCTFIYGGYTLGSRTTYLMMLLIAVTRYVAICRPGDYYRWFSKPRLNFYLAGLFVIAAVQVSTQQLVVCHYPLTWVDFTDQNWTEITESGFPYDTFKLLWSVNAYEKFGLVVVVLSIITTLYLKILSRMDIEEGMNHIQHFDQDQIRVIRRTFTLYLVYLYFIMFPQSGMELFFTYEFINDQQLKSKPQKYFEYLRLLLIVQFVYSSIYVLNPITVFWLNPAHSKTIKELFRQILILLGILKLDEGSIAYRWRWQPRSELPPSNINIQWAPENSVKLFDLDHLDN